MKRPQLEAMLPRFSHLLRYATGDLRQAMLQPLHLLPSIAFSTAIDLVLSPLSHPRFPSALSFC